MFLLTSAVRPLPQQSSHSYPRPAIGSACPSPPASDADKNEICLFFIRRHCSFKGRTSSSCTAFRAGCITLSEHSFICDCPPLFEESLGVIFFCQRSVLVSTGTCRTDGRCSTATAQRGRTCLAWRMSSGLTAIQNMTQTA